LRRDPDPWTCVSASELDRFLTEACKDRPQVIILSGCYSGAMITSQALRRTQSSGRSSRKK
jgi:hypothetical protein